MATGYHPAVLVLFMGLLACTVLGKWSNRKEKEVLRPDFHAWCRTTPGLSKAQMDLCLKNPPAVAAAVQGLKDAVQECQHQFHDNRWNCSSLANRTQNLHASAIFQKGFRETAFAYAISSAGVVISVAKACSKGSLKNCGCDRHKFRTKAPQLENSEWKWYGCLLNLHYSVKFSKMFLDPRQGGSDVRAEVNLHNSNVGRTAVASNMRVKCKCHGLSGSCQMKTCFTVAPDFRVVGTVLKEKYEKAVLVDLNNQVNRTKKRKQAKKSKRVKQWTPHKKKQRRRLKNDLIFYENSPDFCERDQSLDVWGTSGRSCNTTHKEQGSCATLCCGRGHNWIKRRRTESCFCKFHWCCKVECQNCTTEEWISVCK